MKNNFILLALLLVSNLLLSQASTLMTNSEPIDEKRYADIKGSPYLFKENVLGIIIDLNGEVYKDIQINYNGESQTIEAFKADRMTTLDSDNYPRIIIENHNLKKSMDGSLELVKHPNFKGAYVMEIFKDGDVAVYRKFRVSLNSVETNLPGETVTKNRFTPKNEYYIIIDGESAKVNRKDKDFLKVLGHEKELKSYLKKNKNKLKSDQDIKELMEQYVSMQ